MLKTCKDFIFYLVERISATKATEAAAAIGYYTIVSFFPIVLFLIAFHSTILDNPEKQVQVQDQILDFVKVYFPNSREIINEEIIMENIKNLSGSSGTVSLIGSIMLLWSATLVLAGFAQNINQAWTSSKCRHFLMDRLIGVGMMGVMVVFIVSIQLTNTFVEVLPTLFPNFLEPLFSEMSSLHKFVINYLPQLAMLVSLLLLYKYVPTVYVRWREAFSGTVVTLLLLRLLRFFFVLYLEMAGKANYSVVYGSLGAVVAFMLWIYLATCVILIGGHFSAAIAKFTRPDDFIAPERRKNTCCPEVFTNGDSTSVRSA
jgi:membrane protein